MSTKSILVCLLSITVLINFNDASQSCRHRDYHYDSTVCVCSEQHCDTFDPLKPTKPGLVQVYQSTRSGDRFRSIQVHFNNRTNEQQKSHQSSYTFLADHDQRFQKIIGFGGAFTDSAGFNIAKLPEKLQKRLIEDYFGPDGLEYTLGRIPIGGTDFSTHPYSYDDSQSDDDSLAKFKLQDEDFKYKIPYIKMAKQVSPHSIRYLACPWSSPAWMKNNNELNHGGLIKGRPGEKYYKLFAKYLIRFLEEYRSQNISMWALSVENEPDAGFDPNYRFNSLGFNGTLERDFLKLDLGPELYKNGFTKDKLEIIIFEDQLPICKEFNDAVLSDNEAAKYVSGIGFHWYDTYKGDRNDLDYFYKKYPNVFLLATEACEEWMNQLKHVNLGSWHLFNRYADDIIQDLNHYVTGWIDWNLALDLQGGPNWVANYVDSPIIVNETAKEYYKQPSFYALGHFSKFLLPESTRLGLKVESNEVYGLESTIFERPDNGTVLIILNTNKKEIQIEVIDSKINSSFQYKLQPESMTNFLWY